MGAPLATLGTKLTAKKHWALVVVGPPKSAVCSSSVHFQACADLICVVSSLKAAILTLPST